MRHVVGEAKMGLGKSSACAVNVSVHTVHNVASLCGDGDVQVKPGQGVCQFHVVKVPSDHLRCPRMFCLWRANGVMQFR